MYDLSSCRSIYERMEAFSSNADLENPCNSPDPNLRMIPGAWINNPLTAFALLAQLQLSTTGTHVMARRKLRRLGDLRRQPDFF